MRLELVRVKGKKIRIQMLKLKLCKVEKGEKLVTKLLKG